MHTSSAGYTVAISRLNVPYCATKKTKRKISTPYAGCVSLSPIFTRPDKLALSQQFNKEGLGNQPQVGVYSVNLYRVAPVADQQLSVGRSPSKLSRKPASRQVSGSRARRQQNLEQLALGGGRKRCHDGAADLDADQHITPDPSEPPEYELAQFERSRSSPAHHRS
ncbi:hypothetical protein GEV33_003432 [Tenebrio molitor]|uniref:Uncharacterized protein n=1 Tax=Tenebrio molitor TaxID=7067 RepID=A0A8J6HR79_TENMO|nr:hypothetical protein GEV33_003432 [Tenebrio molitor]